MAKDSFILYNDQKEVFDSLSDEGAGRLIKAIFKYQFNENVELDGMLKIAFIPIKQSLDRNKEKYEKVVERNKKAKAHRAFAFVIYLNSSVTFVRICGQPFMILYPISAGLAHCIAFLMILCT